MADGRAVCGVCPHACALSEGRRGLCRARVAYGGRVVDENYGRVTSIALDPVEKKPLARFRPGSTVLSLGSYGCNLRCPFCQNADIACAGAEDAAWRYVAPEEAVGLALMGIEFVLVLRFGPERGRYFLIGVVWVPIILLTVVKKHPAFNGLVQAVGGMDSWPVGQLAAFFGGLVIVGAIVYAVCWRIGVGIYRKKEL